MAEASTLNLQFGEQVTMLKICPNNHRWQCTGRAVWRTCLDETGITQKLIAEYDRQSSAWCPQCGRLARTTTRAT